MSDICQVGCGRVFRGAESMEKAERHEAKCDGKKKAPKVEDTAEHVFTFGFGQTHPVTGADLASRYVVIRATCRATAREEMVRRFALRWGFQYPDHRAAGVDRFGLRSLEGNDALGLLGRGL